MHDQLQGKIKVLSKLMWEGRGDWAAVEQWLSNFSSSDDPIRNEQLHALFLLSHFSYYNATLMRVLLRALYRDFVQYPIIERLRKRRRNTLDWSTLAPHYERAIKRIRFVGIGNPSESATHLLYYFRQENKLQENLFLHHHELFEGTASSPKLIKGIEQLIFIDDFCGSGTQAARYSKKLLKQIRELDNEIKLSYYPLFATTDGLNRVRTRTLFTNVQTVCELDASFRALEDSSRYFRELHATISREFAADMCRRFGTTLEPSAPLGFGNCQLLLGFAHNIPNNTLPIFWSEGTPERSWDPIFPRYTKGVGW